MKNLKSIKTLNSISNIIYENLDAQYAKVSDNETNPDAIIVRSASCHEMDFNTELKAIARAGAGVNNIPVDKCTEAGIVVFNTPGANANAVKELVFGAMSIAARNICDGIEWARTLKGKGADVPKLVEKGKSQFVGPELYGKTIGVIGLGAIGVMVANNAHATGMKVIGYDPFISVEHAWKLSRAITRVYSIEEVMQQSDYISIHIPLMELTRGMLNAGLLKLAKPNLIVLNFARGELVVTADILAALSERKIAKYITDFPNDELLCQDGVICIPHLGASTPESEENCAQMASAQLRDFLDNGNIVNSVNLPACEMPRSGAMRVAVIHRNITNMVGQITAIIADKSANISTMVNKSRGDIAYTMLDLDDATNGDLVERLMGIEGVIRVTIYK